MTSCFNWRSRQCRYFVWLPLLALFQGFLVGCGDGNQSKNAKSLDDAALTLNVDAILPKTAFEEVDWTDLMPEEDIKALMTPPAYLSEIPDGSFADTLEGEFADTSAPPTDDPYQQALRSTKVKPEMDGKLIKLPGFIVPLEFDDNQVVTQFFLVPFFGACLHVPPPPPNQILFVNHPEGIKQEALNDAFWVYGKLEISTTQNELATSAYSMVLHHLEPYSE